MGDDFASAPETCGWSPPRLSRDETEKARAEPPLAPVSHLLLHPRSCPGPAPTAIPGAIFGVK